MTATPHLHVTRVPGCPLCPVLDSGPFCRECETHRAMSVGGLCPGCSADRRNADRIGGAA